MAGSTRTVAPIQGLRAGAAWLVVFHHYLQIYQNFKYTNKVEQFFAGFGAFGVDIFFIVSGMVMYISLTTRQRSAGVFWGERVTRIVPNYWLHTLVLLLLWPLHSLPTWKTGWTPESLLKSAFFVPVDNPGSGSMTPLLQVGWTLNFEMFFYTVLALCVLLTPKRGLFLTAGLLFLCPLFWQEDWIGGYLLSSTQLWEFSAGIALGWFHTRHFSKLANRTSWGAVLMLTALFILVFLRFPQKRLLCAGVVVLGALMVNHELMGTRAGRFITHLGDISYSTYLNHTVILGLGLLISSKYGSINQPALNLPVLVICIYLCSIWTYKHVETGGGKRMAKAAVARIVPGYSA